jgi:hypothetical protein
LPELFLFLEFTIQLTLVTHIVCGQVDSYGGTHAKDNTYQATDGLLIGLAPFDDTSNPGGVYILATCFLGSSSAVHTVAPSDCKYDAFKVRGPTPPEGGVDLTGLKTATGSYTRSFSWTTTKTASPTYVATNANTTTANYVVTVIKSAGVDSGFTVGGQVMVFNSNDSEVTGVSVADAIGLTSCTVTGGSSSIAAGDSATFNYTCSLTGVTASSTGTNTATISWDQASINSPNASATAMANWDFSASPTLVGNCTTVSDTLKGLLGTVCDTHTFNYSLSLNVPTAGCTTYPNTASETTSGTSASASVQVCRTNSNGFTMGYWANKNGQAQIAGAYAGICTYLAQYSNVLTMPSPCTARSLDAYVSSVISAANASGTGAPMFKGQFLATALSAYFSSSLANTGIAVDSSIFGSSCLKVSALLTFGNTNYAALSANKTTFMAVKSVYDSINNDIAVTC